MIEFLVWWGASLLGMGNLSGQVLFEETLVPAANVTVGLEATRIGAPRSDGFLITTTTDQDGRFHFPLLGPAAYDLTVVGPRQLVRDSPPVVVSSGAQVELDEPLLIGSRQHLQVYLMPPTDPYGDIWRLHVFRQVGERTLSEVPTETVEATLSGDWSTWLPPGDYRLEVQDSTRSTWHLEGLTIGADPLPSLQIGVPYVAVEGRVRFADGDPVVGTLWFGGRHGARALRIETDEEGRFVGVLPGEGEWVVDLEQEDLGSLQSLGKHRVERLAGHPLARVDFELPDTRLAGRAIDERGEGLAEIPVLMIDPAAKRHHRIQTDENGEFEMRGLSPTRLLIRAEAPGRQSRWVTLLLQEGLHPPDLELVLFGRRVLEGVVSVGGRVLPGAEIRVMALSELGAREMIESTADGHGRFEAELPPGATSADVLVLPPGFAATGFHVQIGQIDEEAPRRTFEVAPAGGVLEIELGAEGRVRDLVLTTGEASFSAHLLEFWATRTGGGSLGDRWRVPNVAPGNYSVCRSTGSEMSCDEGVLVQGGSLILRLSGSDPPPSDEDAGTESL